MMSKIHHLLATHLMSSVAILGLTAATPAMAQQAAQQSVAAGEIVVTAQRRSERLQDVPLAVSATAPSR
jgi:iron complex outermembrane receptor protein